MTKTHEIDCRIVKDGDVEKFAINNWPENHKEAVATWGDAVCFDCLTGTSVTVKAQAVYRTLRRGTKSKPGLPAKKAAEMMAEWKPVVGRQKIPKAEKLAKEIATLSADDKARLIAQLTAK